ncbi:MAG: single-stranded-DNA-specific exonuclease RecJ [Armatimonadetes bacterium]|nr:single-stranded-DNA-specific exonuclease RecJ [Armatimonadota bacterium]
MRSSIWRPAADRRDEARQAARDLAIDPVVAHILLNRGLTPEAMPEFLRPTLASLHDPALLPDMAPAAERLATAVREQQSVCIYGDYDADGSTAGALLYKFLLARGVKVNYYVPDRFDEGYGLNAGAVIRVLTQHKPNLMVTVDCGVSGAAEIETAVSLGVDVIVTDHHLPPERLPAVPTVDPQRAESQYPQKEICGAAVAYKLCLKTAELLGEDPKVPAAELLELVAIGTVADIMPLVGENRFFVYHGLKRLGRTTSPGLLAMLQIAGLGKSGRLSARDIGFGIGPRLNAAGRLETARAAFDLLTTEDNQQAWELADSLEKLNRERREVESRLTDLAHERVRNLSLHEKWGLVVSGDGWHEGVVGLVASRLCQRYHRPTLVISISGENAKGSGRSTNVVDLHAALNDCADLLTGFGGHHHAAGFSLPAANIEALCERFDAAVRSRMTEDDLTPVVEYECAVKGRMATLELARQLAALEPFGHGNPAPVLKLTDVEIASVRVTNDGNHLQLSFRTDMRGQLKAFWPQAGQNAERVEVGARVEAVGSLAVDSWNGEERAQFTVSDLRYASRG